STLAQLQGHRFEWRSTSLHSLISAKRAGLECHKHGRLVIRDHVRVQLAEKNAASEHHLAAADRHADAIANHSPAKARGQLRRKVAHQVRVGHDYILRLSRPNYL